MSKFCCSTQSSADALLLCESSRKCHHTAQTMPTSTKPILTCFTKLIAVQPSMAEYEWTMYQIKVDKLCYHALKSVLLYLFSMLRNLESNPGFLLRNSIKLLTQNLEKSNFGMFYKKLLLSSHLFSIMHDQCVIWKRNNSTIIPW